MIFNHVPRLLRLPGDIFLSMRRRSKVILLVLGCFLSMHIAQIVRGICRMQDVAATPTEQLLKGRTADGEPVGLIMSADGTLLLANVGYTYDVLPFGVATYNQITVVLAGGSRHTYTDLWWFDCDDRFGYLGTPRLCGVMAILHLCTEGPTEVYLNGQRLYTTASHTEYSPQQLPGLLQDFFD